MDVEGDLRQALALAGRALEGVRAGSVHVPTEVLAAQVGLAQRVISAVVAIQTVRVAQFAARDEERDPETGAFTEVDRGLGQVEEFAADTLAPMLALSPGAAARKVDLAAVIVCRLPGTLVALADGGLDESRAQVLAGELRDADAEVCAAVEARVLPVGEGETCRKLASRVRKVLAEVDADAVRARAVRARLDRYVRTYPGAAPGVTDWVASLPAEDSLRCWAAIDALAHQRHQNDPGRTLEQCRADAFVDLIEGNATITTQVQVMVPVETLSFPGPDPAPTVSGATSTTRTTSMT